MNCARDMTQAYARRAGVKARARARYARTAGRFAPVTLKSRVKVFGPALTLTRGRRAYNALASRAHCPRDVRVTRLRYDTHDVRVASRAHAIRA